MTCSACVLATLAVLASTAPGAQRAEGTILVARGHPILVATASGQDLVEPARGASLRGLSQARDLRAGDRLRYTWTREVSGVKLADSLEVDPTVAVEPTFVAEAGALAEPVLAGVGPLVLDARPAKACRAGHIPGARCLAADAPAAAFAELPADAKAPIIVYGRGPRTEEGPALLRRALAGGHDDVRLLAGGLQRWFDLELPVGISAEEAAVSVAAGGLLAVDARAARDFETETVAGAISLPPSAFRWRDFDGSVRRPALLLFGSDAADRSPYEIAYRVRKLRSNSAARVELALYVLEGGFAAWKAARLPTVKGAVPSAEMPSARPSVPAEIAPAEFARLWSERGGASVTFVDVRQTSPRNEEFVQRIPLEELRLRLAQLPKDKEVLVFCSVGERSRVAQALLAKNGFRARFLRAAPP